MKPQSPILANPVVETESNRPLRVTFLTVMPAPYMIDLFDAFHKDPRFELTVHFLEKPAVAAPGVFWEEKPLPPYSTVLPGKWFSFSRARVHINSRLFQSLKKGQPDIVVVMGYNSLTCQLAMYWLWLNRIPWIFWGETPGFEHRGITGMFLRWLAQRPVACLSNGIAAIGSTAVAAYSKLTHKLRPIRNIPYFCRNQSLLDIQRSQSSSCIAPHFLFCGQLVPRKGVDMLVRSFCQLASHHEGIRLTLVGGGPLRDSLASVVPDSIGDRVVWAGFKEIDELTPYFAEASVFVLPSVHDGWGVVINQAISAGMAVIASNKVGAALDLVQNGINGILFPSQNEIALTEAMGYFVENPEKIAQFGKESRQRAQHLQPEQGVERWFQLFHAVQNRRCELHRYPDCH